MEITYCDFRSKSVINVADGRDLGHACDLTFDDCGKILGFTVPGDNTGFLGIIKGEPLFIPWNKICKIGSDVVLVSLTNGEKEPNPHNIE
ncbi:MAG: YlmC/YmxH family sporulation protein [Clostridia bacterium]|nr:YlmC/YmxH family sporulation protein [Clostridia bacterium]